MTCAGVSVWLYAAAALAQDPEHVDELRKSATATRGRDWLRRHHNPGYFKNAYYLAGLERVGTLLARPKHEWYSEGANHLIRKQILRDCGMTTQEDAVVRNKSGTKVYIDS